MTGVGVIGTGFMGLAHTEALRRLGLDVVGIVGSSPERARAKATAAKAGGVPLPRVVDSVEALLRDPAVEAVHVTSPNHLHVEHATAVIAAGKHVVCEKPLGVSAAETAGLLARADDAGVVHATCFNLRHYPQNVNAAAMVAAGAIGEPRFITGRYHQDWLLLETDWNWRLDARRQGGLRAVADIGSHWLDLVQAISGRRIVEVVADLHTFVTERHHPVGDVETFAAVADDVERVREEMESDDAAGVLLRFDDGLRGACTVSQVSAGRKNTVQWQLDGSTDALAWAAEDPERLWIGHRSRPNEVLEKDAAVMTAAGVAAAGYPAGHVEGYPDTFRGLFAEVYRDIAVGAPSPRPTYPTFADGHDAVLVGEAIAASARCGSWAKVERS